MAEPENARRTPPFAGEQRLCGLWLGMAGWAVFCLLAVGARGIRWDETFEHAQIIAGQVPYPAGHPLRVYLSHAFSVQPHASAWLMQLGAGPALICGLRNFLFLIAGIWPIYLLAALLARRVWAGHLAALLMLQGILLEFDGSYPMVVWPELYSNGPIGGGWALLTLAALLAGWIRLAWLMAGLMPCVHVGQWPPVLAVCALFAMVDLWRGDRRAVLRALPFGMAGLAVCAAFYLLLRRQGLDAPVSGPFAAAGDPWEVWKGYTALFDPHRRFPPGNGHAVLIGALILAAAALWRERGAALRRIYLGLFAYILAVAGLVWGIMAVHAFTAPNVPFALISWMPYRLINHIPPLCLALIAGILMNQRTSPAGVSPIQRLVRSWGRSEAIPNSLGEGEHGTATPPNESLLAQKTPLISILFIGAVVFGVFQPWLARLIGDALYGRYLSTGEAVAFALYGAALYVVLRGSRWALPAPLATAAGLAFYHQFGAACMAMGSVAAFVLCRYAPGGTLSHSTENGELAIPGACAAAVGVVLLAMATLLAHQAHFRQTLPSSAFEQHAAAYLGENAPPGAMLAGPPDSILLQARTGHPVLAEAATPSLLSYAPALGPSIENLWHDLYGVRFVLPGATAVPWQDLWRNRTAAQWRALAEHYGFAYVAAPADTPLQLPVAVRDSAGVLYRAF